MGKNCWILSTVRTGSTYLCEILNETNLFPPYLKYKKAFSEWFRFYENKDSLMKNLPNTCKVHYSQYCKFFQDYDRELLEAKLNPLYFILLKRKDFVAQAISFAIAKKYKTYIVNIENKVRWNKTSVILTDDEMISAYKELSGCYYKWDKFLNNAQYMVVDYSDLIADPKKQLEKILTYIGMDYKKLKVKCNTFPMTKDANTYYVKRLKCLIGKKLI